MEVNLNTQCVSLSSVHSTTDFSVVFDEVNTLSVSRHIAALGMKPLMRKRLGDTLYLSHADAQTGMSVGSWGQWARLAVARLAVLQRRISAEGGGDFLPPRGVSSGTQPQFLAS